MKLPSHILLTGATGKIGTALARALAASGSSLALVARDPDRLTNLQRSLATAGDGQRFVAVPVDLMAADGAERLHATLATHDFRPGGLVHCARSLDHLKTGADARVGRPQWVDAFMLDVVAGYELIVSLAGLQDSPLRSAVLVSSMYGITPPHASLYENPAHIPPVHYGVCKAAQVQLARELAVRLAGQGVRVNSVAYGGVRGRANPTFEQRYAAHCPAGRMLGEDDLAGPVLYLLSNDSAATTGHNLLAEGGWTVW